MKILFVHSFYQQFGGEDSVVQTESRMLTERGQEVLLWTHHNDETKNYTALQKVAFFPNAVYSRPTVVDIRKVVRQFQPDVAYIHNIYPIISPSIYSTLHEERVPVVQVLHNFRPFCANGLFYINGQVCEKCKPGNHMHAVVNRCFRDSYPLSALYATTLQVNRWTGGLDKIDAFVCLTGFFKEKIMEAGVAENKIFIRPNFISAPTWNSAQQGAGDYAVFLGRLSKEKGVHTLLRAFEKLPDVKLKIVGSGGIEDELKAYVQQKGLRNVEFLGHKSGDEKWAVLRGAMFAVVPSEWYENFPISVLEHYAASKPVIASRIGGLPYIVEDGKTGYLHEAGSADDLAAKVRQMLADPDYAVKMGRVGRELVETRYGAEEGYTNLMNIFSKMVAR